MANLDVQPKKRGSVWIWIILVLVILAIVFTLMRGCNKSYQPTALKTTDQDSTLNDTTGHDSNILATTEPNWDVVDFDLARSSDADITDTTIVVRGTDQYTVYGLGENILFAQNASILQNTADARLKMITASLNKHYNNPSIGIYGHTDSTGSAGANRTLGGRRADAVKNWLITKGGFPAAAISVHSLGEAKPLATNGTDEGRMQNRSVEIVAFTARTK